LESERRRLGRKGEIAGEPGRNRTFNRQIERTIVGIKGGTMGNRRGLVFNSSSFIVTIVSLDGLGHAVSVWQV
jgi:hypothetical protein